MSRSTRSIEMDDDDWTKVDSHGDSLPDYSYPSLSVRLYLAAYEARPPEPFKVGDIVHCDNDYAGDAKLVIKALGEDVAGPQAWCLDGDGYLGTYQTEDLTPGVRP